MILLGIVLADADVESVVIASPAVDFCGQGYSGTAKDIHDPIGVVWPHGLVFDGQLDSGRYLLDTLSLGDVIDLYFASRILQDAGNLVLVADGFGVRSGGGDGDWPRRRGF